MATYKCPGCGYTYDEVKGHDFEGFPPGTPWSAVPDDWACPDCAVRDKVDFELVGGEEAAPAPKAQKPAAAKKAPAPKPKAKAKSKPAAKKKVAASPKAKAKANGEPFQKWVCLTCGDIYDEALGDPFEGIAPGTRFSDLPDTWICPDCGTAKDDFVLLEEE
jgi:rubredoxin